MSLNAFWKFEKSVYQTISDCTMCVSLAPGSSLHEILHALSAPRSSKIGKPDCKCRAERISLAVPCLSCSFLQVMLSHDVIRGQGCQRTPPELRPILSGALRCRDPICRTIIRNSGEQHLGGRAQCNLLLDRQQVLGVASFIVGIPPRLRRIRRMKRQTLDVGRVDILLVIQSNPSRLLTNQRICGVQTYLLRWNRDVDRVSYSINAHIQDRLLSLSWAPPRRLLRDEGTHDFFFLLNSALFVLLDRRLASGRLW